MFFFVKLSIYFRRNKIVFFQKIHGKCFFFHCYVLSTWKLSEYFWRYNQFRHHFTTAKKLHHEMMVEFRYLWKSAKFFDFHMIFWKNSFIRFCFRRKYIQSFTKRKNSIFGSQKYKASRLCTEITDFGCLFFSF